MLKKLLPWNKKNHKLTQQKRGEIFTHDFHKQFNDLFDSFFDDYDRDLLPGLWNFEKNKFSVPEVDMLENDKEIKISANLPGIDDNEIKINLDGDRLIIEGEKCEAKEDKDTKYYLSERRCGYFKRVISVPAEMIDHEKIKASLKKGVLKVILPKKPEKAGRQKRIEISTQ